MPVASPGARASACGLVSMRFVVYERALLRTSKPARTDDVNILLLRIAWITFPSPRVPSRRTRCDRGRRDTARHRRGAACGSRGWWCSSPLLAPRPIGLTASRTGAPLALVATRSRSRPVDRRFCRVIHGCPRRHDPLRRARRDPVVRAFLCAGSSIRRRGAVPAEGAAGALPRRAAARRAGGRRGDRAGPLLLADGEHRRSGSWRGRRLADRRGAAPLAPPALAPLGVLVPPAS